MAYISVAVLDEDQKMDRTLFFPFMLDTYKACKRAYELARTRLATQPEKRSLASICKQFVRKGVGQINKGKIQNNNHLQLFIGQHWPVDKLEACGFTQDQIARSFLYTYKTLLHYLRCPYIPADAEVVATAQKVRSKVHRAGVYLEDTFDLVLWYPEKQHLEIVDFRLKLPNSILTEDPIPSLLARHFLANKLKVRWPFKTLTVSTVKLTPKALHVSEVELKEETFNNNWDEIVRDLESMKSPLDLESLTPHENCKYCSLLTEHESQDKDSLSMSA